MKKIWLWPKLVHDNVNLFINSTVHSCMLCRHRRCQVASVVSDSVRPHRRQPTRLPGPWDSPGKNPGVGCHFLLQCRKVKSESEVTQSYPTLPDPMYCSLPGSFAHGIFQARVLERAAIAFSACLLSRVQLFVTLWTVAHKTPLSVGFSRQEYWSGLPFPPLGIFPTQGSNQSLLHWQADSLPLSHLGISLTRQMCVKYLICARCCVGLWRHKIS